MLGTNEIRLCKAEMHRAVEFYLNTKILREEHAVAVQTVTENSVEFVVEVKAAGVEADTAASPPPNVTFKRS